MQQEEKNSIFSAPFRRLLYMVVAIVASAVLFMRPVFNFQDDKGIVYVRSFSMNQKSFIVTQTDLKTGVPHITATMSVKGLYICNQFMLWGCVLSLLLFWDDRWRITVVTLTALIAGAYYILMLLYAMQMSSDHYATLYPNIMAVLPAIVCQMMVLTRQNIIHQNLEAEDNALEEPNQPYI